jgi:hypothetical protein
MKSLLGLPALTATAMALGLSDASRLMRKTESHRSQASKIDLCALKLVSVAPEGGVPDAPVLGRHLGGIKVGDHLFQ